MNTKVLHFLIIPLKLDQVMVVVNHGEGVHQVSTQGRVYVLRPVFTLKRPVLGPVSVVANPERFSWFQTKKNFVEYYDLALDWTSNPNINFNILIGQKQPAIGVWSIRLLQSTVTTPVWSPYCMCLTEGNRKIFQPITVIN